MRLKIAAVCAIFPLVLLGFDDFDQLRQQADRPDAETVTGRCLACHAGPVTESHPAKACPVSTTNCASCHMPKVTLPGGHKVFTDHQIRIARPGDPYPD